MTRYGTMRAGAAAVTAVAQTSSFTSLLAADTALGGSRMAVKFFNPTANGILSLSLDGVTTTVEVAAGASYDVREADLTLQWWGKVVTPGNVNVSVSR